jgi:hypothetical protein
MSDATSNGNDGTANTLTSVSGQMGAGVSTNGTSSSMSFNNGTSLNSTAGGAFTYSTWVKVPVAETLGAIVSSRSSTDGGAVVIDLMVGMNGGTTNAGRLMALVRDDTNGTYAQVVGAAINDNAWHYVTLTRSGSNIELYMDTTSQGTASGAGVASTFTTNLRDLGKEGRWIQDNYTTPTTNAYLGATFDELRYSSSVRSVDWITTDYNNQTSPSTFYSYTTGSGAEVATNATTDARLTAFEAVATCDGTAIHWRTAFELDTLGFNVVRESNGTRATVNATLIPGAGLTGGGSHDYQVVDPVAFQATASYWLEEVDFQVRSKWFGPVSAPAASDCGASARPMPAPLSTDVPSAAVPHLTGADLDDGMGGCAIGGYAGEAALATAARLLAVALVFLIRATRPNPERDKRERRRKGTNAGADQP